jgi:hypothetical protein
MSDIRIESDALLAAPPSGGSADNRGVAQGTERTHPKRKVAGSSPAAPASFDIKRVAIGIDESGQVEYMPVEQRGMTGGKLGYLDRRKRLIAINEDQPEVGKYLVLLHEMCHAAAEDLKAAGIVKRQPTEAFIQFFAARLFGMLAFSELWRGVTREQARGFFGSERGAQ